MTEDDDHSLSGSAGHLWTLKKVAEHRNPDADEILAGQSGFSVN